MAYSKTTWVDAVTPLGPTNMNKLEQAVSDLKYLSFNVNDYGAIGDGNTTHAGVNISALQAAATAASAAGGAVLIPPGVYRVTNSSTFTSLANFALVGAGRGLSIIEYDVNDTDGLLFSGCTNVTVKGITFRHKAAQVTRTTAQNLRFYQCTDVAVQDCEISYSKSLGLVFEETTNVRCERNYVHDTLADGIHVRLPRGTVMIRDNRVESAADDMIAVWNYTTGASAAGTYTIQIDGNKLKTTTGTGVGSGIKVAGVEDFEIRGNTIRDTRAAGIAVVKTLVASIVAGACRNGVISGNVVTSPGLAGATGPYGGIETTSYDAAGALLLTTAHENISITGNTVDAAQHYGIEVAATRGATVTGNTIINPNRANLGLPYGINLEGIVGGTCSGNTVTYTSGTTNWMIHAGTCTDLRITGNHGNGFSTTYFASALVDGTTTRVFVEAAGPGTPEGAVVNPVGSIWHCTDGGAATSLYVKASGTGNTGWITMGGAYATVASAATIAVPAGATVVSVTGTTTITSVTAGYAGQVVTLVFAGILTFTDGSNLKLASNFVTTADDSITLVCDGTNWFETARSVN